MKRLCAIHGLWDKTTTMPRCPKCKQSSSRQYDKNYRNKESDKFYHSRAWKRVSSMQLNSSPLCVVCGEPAKIADHKVEIKDGGSKLSLDNLQSMCVSCHNVKTSREKNMRGGAVKSLEGKAENTEPPNNFRDKPFSGDTL